MNAFIHMFVTLRRGMQYYKHACIPCHAQYAYFKDLCVRVGLIARLCGEAYNNVFS